MIHPPLILRLRMGGGHLPRIRLWLPLFLLWPIVALLVLLLSPLALLALAAGFFFFSVRLNPFEVLWECYRMLCALRGTRIDVESGAQGHHIHIDLK